MKEKHVAPEKVLHSPFPRLVSYVTRTTGKIHKTTHLSSRGGSPVPRTCQPPANTFSQGRKVHPEHLGLVTPTPRNVTPIILKKTLHCLLIFTFPSQIYRKENRTLSYLRIQTHHLPSPFTTSYQTQLLPRVFASLPLTRSLRSPFRCPAWRDSQAPEPLGGRTHGAKKLKKKKLTRIQEKPLPKGFVVDYSDTRSRQCYSFYFLPGSE